MKRTIIFSILILFLTVPLLKGSLVDVYKKGKVRLVPVSEFAASCNWSELFSYYQVPRTYKDLIMAADGSIFVCNYSSYNFCKFDANGNFIKKFWETGRRPKGKTSAYGRPDYSLVLEGKYLLVSELGKMNLFDLEGREVKTLKVDYPVEDCEPLIENTIAVVAFILRGGKRPNKYIVALKDIMTEKETILAETVRENEERLMISYKEGNGYVGFSLPFAFMRLFVRRTPEGNVIVGSSHSPAISVFDKDGRKIREFQLKIKPIEVGEKAKNEFYEGLSKASKKYNFPSEAVEKIEKSKEFFPKFMPYFYNLLVDSDGNLLVFTYPKESPIPVFQVYSPAGEFICETRLDTDEYTIPLRASMKRAAFFNGYLYALAEKKHTSGIPLRLVKFRVEN